MSADDRELLIIQMETSRNVSEDAYFKARSQLDTQHNRKLFAAGFERAFMLETRPKPRELSEHEVATIQSSISVKIKSVLDDKSTNIADTLAEIRAIINDHIISLG